MAFQEIFQSRRVCKQFNDVSNVECGTICFDHANISARMEIIEDSKLKVRSILIQSQTCPSSYFLKCMTRQEKSRYFVGRTQNRLILTKIDFFWEWRVFITCDSYGAHSTEFYPYFPKKTKFVKNYYFFSYGGLIWWLTGTMKLIRYAPKMWKISFLMIFLIFHDDFRIL